MIKKQYRYGMLGLLMAYVGFAYGMGGMSDDFNLSSWRRLRARQTATPTVSAVESIKHQSNNVRLQEITAIKKDFQKEREQLTANLKTYEDRASRMQRDDPQYKQLPGEAYVLRELPAAKGHVEMSNDLMQRECAKWSPFNKCEQNKLELDSARKNLALVQKAKTNYANLDKVNYSLKKLEREEQALMSNSQKIARGGMSSPSIPMQAIYTSINWFAQKWWGLR